VRYVLGLDGSQHLLDICSGFPSDVGAVAQPDEELDQVAAGTGFVAIGIEPRVEIGEQLGLFGGAEFGGRYGSVQTHQIGKRHRRGFGQR
jgi:hypothetical protein